MDRYRIVGVVVGGSLIFLSGAAWGPSALARGAAEVVRETTVSVPPTAVKATVRPTEVEQARRYTTGSMVFTFPGSAGRSNAIPLMQAGAGATTGTTYVAYFWRAKPGQFDAYNKEIRTVT